MAEAPLPRPLHESDLRHERRSRPHELPHLLGRDPAVPPRALGSSAKGQLST
jgi:hypothetical protein